MQAKNNEIAEKNTIIDNLKRKLEDKDNEMNHQSVKIAKLTNELEEEKRQSALIQFKYS